MLRSRLRVLAATLLLVFVSGLTAQLNRGTITGTVHDSTGAVVSGVGIVIRNAETGAEYDTKSNPAGQYTMPNLPAGRYELTFETDGFKRFVRGGVVISATDVARVDATLELGATTESVSVTAALPRMQTDAPEVSTNLSNEDMVDIPFSFSGGRLMENMTYGIMPGVFGNRWNNDINGSVDFTRDALLDGASTTSWMQGVHVLVSFSMEAVQEFKVMTSGVSAEFGKTSGSMYNYVFKSGTNELHGSAYGAIRNEVLNANSFGNNARGIDRSLDRRWNWAFSGGGPVYIPKVYDGRNKTFFYAAIEHYKERSLTFGSPNRTVPLPEWYDGDLSRLLRGTTAGTDALGRPVEAGAIFDPSSFEQLPNGRWVGEAFPQNRIPVSRFSNVARNLNEIMKASYLPNFRAANGVIPLTNNFFSTTSPIPITDDRFFSVKMDHIISTRHKLSGSYNRDKNDRLIANAGGLWPANEPTGGRLRRGFWRDEPGQLARLAHDWTISPSILNHITFSLNRYRRNDFLPEEETDGAKELGISGLSTLGYPDIQWGSGPFVNLEPVGFQQSRLEAATAFGILDTFSIAKGNHFFKAGADIRTNAYNTRPLQGTTLRFNPRSTAIPGESFSGNLTGFSFASYLLGIVDSGSQNDPVGIGMRLRYYAFFFQDDWKVTPKLTLNLGLRWEFQPPQYEVNDQFSSWNPSKIDPVSGLPGAYDFAGDCAVCTGKRYFGRKSYRDWAPRIGLAYRLNDKTTVRAAYGIFYAPEMFNNFGGTPLPKLTNVQAGGTFSLDPNAVQPWAGVFRLDNGFPGAAYTPAAFDPSWGNGNRPGMIDADYGRTGYNQNWNFNIQRELPGRIVLDLGYIGNKSTGYKFGDAAVVNQLSPDVLRTHGSRLSNAVTNSEQAAANGVAYPFAGFRGTVASALRPYPQVQGNSTVAVYGAPLGHSTYHSLQIVANRQLAEGLTLYTSYVWAKTLTNMRSAQEGQNDNPGRPLDYYNLALEKSYADRDRPHFFKVYANYELPIGRNLRGAAKALLSGWAVSAILNYGSGTPMMFTGSRPNSLWNGVASRANVSAGELRAAGFKRGEFDLANPSSSINTYLIRDQFSDPQPNTLGTVSRFVGHARFPGTISEDIALIKNTYIGENCRFQIRADMLNAFNRTSPGGINTSVTNAQFGQVTGRDGNRVIQIGARLEF